MAVPEPDETMDGFTIYNDKNEEVASWSTVSDWVRKSGELTKNIRISITSGWDGILSLWVNSQSEIICVVPLSTGRGGDVYTSLHILDDADVARLYFDYYSGGNYMLENIPVETSDSSLLGITENRSLDYI